MTIKRIKQGKIQVIELTPDEIARELIRDEKMYGAASGSINRLAIEAASKKYPSLKKNPAGVSIKIIRAEGQPPNPWGEKSHIIMRDWVNMGKDIEGYRFAYSSSYADLPETLSLTRPSPQYFSSSKRRQLRITPKMPKLR